MKLSEIALSRVAKESWKPFALYTIENRAIPSMIDGLKSSQRFYLYSSIVNTPRDFERVSAVAGVVSRYGYNHGEGACGGAGQLMAADWNNNVMLIEPRGAFGTRLVQKPGAQRYTYTRVHKNFQKYVKDLDLAPVHEDPAHSPPMFYIPVIPLVLANGVNGVATGFATSILPRSAKDIAAACEEFIRTGDIKNRLPITFPQFLGTVTQEEDMNRWICQGVISRPTKTKLIIEEVPYGFDRENYVKVLDELEEKGMIIDWVDQCSKTGFQFEVKLKQDTAKLTDEKLMQLFKLVKPFSENLTVLDQHGKLKIYNDERDLIKDFVRYRMTILTKRIEREIDRINLDIRWAMVRKVFIKAIAVDESIEIRKRKKAELIEDIRKLSVDGVAITEEEAERLLRLQLASLTEEDIADLSAQIDALCLDLDRWKTTTDKKQFLQDLKDLSK